MRTSKPISTISYNTEAYLQEKLKQLMQEHIISDWIFIKHHKEIDERKDHIHLYMKPNRLVDTMSIQDFMKEYDPSHPDKPLECKDFRTSTTDDWILYSMHFEPYLVSKGEFREYHYTPEDFKYADEDNFQDNLNHALKGSAWAQQMQVVSLIAKGDFDPLNLILSGQVPINQAMSIRVVQSMVQERMVVRNSKSHTPIEEGEKNDDNN